MEIEAFRESVQYINMCVSEDMKESEPVEGYTIVTDSQNTHKTVDQKQFPIDEAIILKHKEICSIFNQMDKHDLNDGFIKLYWTPSHEDSVYNNEVDCGANAAAKIAMFLADNSGWEEHVLNPNNMISMSTVKSELRYKIELMEDYLWEIYKSNSKSKHWKKWNIQRSDKFGKELKYMGKSDHIILMFLRTDHLPLMHYKYYHDKQNTSITPLCQQHEDCVWEESDPRFGGNLIFGHDETLEHFMLHCPEYADERHTMMELVKMYYNTHDKFIEDEGKKNWEKKIVNFEETEKDILKLLLFPPNYVCMDIRVRILQSVTQYVRMSRRISCFITFN